MISTRPLVSAAAVLAMTSGVLAGTTTAATAGVPWQVLPTGTTEPITAADYRGSTVAFATATGKIFMGSDSGGFTVALDVPGLTFADLALNPSGDRGVALAENRIWTYDGAAWSEAELGAVTYDLSSPTDTYPNGFCPGTPGTPGTYPPADLHPEVDLVDVEWSDDSTAFVTAFGAESMLLGTVDGGATWTERGRDSAGNCLLDGTGISRPPALAETPGVLWLIHRGEIYKSADGFSTASEVDKVGNKTGVAVDPSNPLRQLAWQEDVHYTAGAVTTVGDFDDYDWLDTTTPGAHDGAQAIRDVVAAPGVWFVVGTGGMVERVRTSEDIERIPVPGQGGTEWRDVALNGGGRMMVAGGPGVVAVSTDPTAPTTLTPGDLPPASDPPVAGNPSVQGGFVVVKVRGRVGRPAGVSESEACRGKVKVTFIKPKNKKSGARKVKTTKIGLDDTCAYQKKIRLKRVKLAGSRKVRMVVVFPGNDAMGRSKAAYTLKIRG